MNKDEAKDYIVSEHYPELAEAHYVEVDHNYTNPTEGKGQPDAVSLITGSIYPDNTKDIYHCINISPDAARSFAQAILNVCDEIETPEVVEQEEKIKRLENAVDYVLTAKPEHYDDVKNMLDDLKFVINSTLEGK